MSITGEMQAGSILFLCFILMLCFSVLLYVDVVDVPSDANVLLHAYLLPTQLQRRSKHPYRVIMYMYTLLCSPCAVLCCAMLRVASAV